MSVKLIDNQSFYGFRVRRTINGTLYQEYFPLKANRKRLSKRATAEVKKQALARDAELIALRDKDRKKRRAELCFHADGGVRGISHLVKVEKSGRKTPIFQMGIVSAKDGKIICTSYSINAHGKLGAWRKIVDAYAAHKKISKGSKLYKQILGAMDATVNRKRRRQQR